MFLPLLTAMSTSPASVQMDEVRGRAQSLLSSSGSAQSVKADVQAMASVALPLSEKYLHVPAEVMLKENAVGRNKQEVIFSPTGAFPGCLLLFLISTHFSDLLMNLNRHLELYYSSFA